MGPSEQQVETRLAALRRRREAIDREIADLLLYLELGRRLSDVGPGSPDPSTPAGPEAAAIPSVADDRDRRPDPGAQGSRPQGSRPHGSGRDEADAARRGAPASSPASHPATAASGRSGPVAGPRSAAAASEPSSGGDGDLPPAIGFSENPTAARRYGRALMEAACAVVAEAGRPMHAGEILRGLVARGFVVPGRDPVAALNTRLWKRASPDGPLRRLGDASYAAARPDDGEGNRGGGRHRRDGFEG